MKKIFDYFKNENGQKMVTNSDKIINSEIGTISQPYIMPRFNRNLACEAYEGYWSAALDYNANAAANGIIRLYSKTSSNGKKCLFNTKKHKDIYQNKFINGQLEDKPSAEVMYKNMDSQEDFEIVQGHPVTKLFRRANPTQSTFQLFFDIFINLEIYGDAFIHVVSFSDGTPSQLYVLSSKDIDIVPGRPNSGKLVEGYRYKNTDGNPQYYPEDEIIHIKYYNPKSIFWGMGKIEKGWQSYILNKCSHEYQTALYANNAVPSYLLINKSGNSVSKKRFMKKMRSFNKGAANAGNVMGVDGDIDVKTVAFAPKDLSDVTLTVQEIASVSGCPLTVLVGNDQTKSNTKDGNISWKRYVVLPMMNLVASSLSEGLLWRYGIDDGDAYLSFDNPVPEDREQKLKENDTYLQNGTLTINEVRSSLGRDLGDDTLDKHYYKGILVGDTTFNSSEQGKNVDVIDIELREKIDKLIEITVDANNNKDLKDNIKSSINNSREDLDSIIVNTIDKSISDSQENINSLVKSTIDDKIKKLNKQRAIDIVINNGEEDVE